MSDPTTNHRVLEHARRRARIHARNLRRLLESARGPLPDVVAHDVFEGLGVAGSAL